MQLLLDTHAFLWFANDDSNLSSNAKRLIQDPMNKRWLSIASPWEIAVKLNTGKLKLTTPLKQFMARHLPINMIELLPISIEHVSVVSSLSLHHRDPFDRLIISQAIVEKLSIVSADKDFDRYPIHRQW